MEHTQMGDAIVTYDHKGYGKTLLKVKKGLFHYFPQCLFQFRKITNIDCTERLDGFDSSSIFAVLPPKPM